MTGIFKANNPSGNIILFLYAIVLKLPMFLHEHVPQLQPSDGFLYKFLLQVIEPVAKVFPSVYSALTFLLLFMQAIAVNKITNSQRLLRQNSYLTGMTFLLITSLFSEWFSLSAPLIVNTFMLGILAKLCVLYTNPNPKATIFNIGLATGVSAFFYFPSVAFLLFIMAGISIARSFRLQEWLTGLMGILMPVYYFVAWLFLSGKTNTFQFPGFHFSYPHFFSNQWAFAALALILLAAAAGVYFINANINRQVVHTRKSWQLLFLYLIVAALVPFINAGINFSYWMLLTVPLSPVIAAAFFYPKKRIFPLLLHWAIFAVYVAVGFFNK